MASDTEPRMSRKPSVRDLTAFFESKTNDSDQLDKPGNLRKNFQARRPTLQENRGLFLRDESTRDGYTKNEFFSRSVSLAPERLGNESHYTKSRDTNRLQYLPPVFEYRFRRNQAKNQSDIRQSSSGGIVASIKQLSRSTSRDQPLSRSNQLEEFIEQDTQPVLTSHPLTNIVEGTMLSQIAEDSPDSPMFGDNVKSVKDAVSSMEANLKKVTSKSTTPPNGRKASGLNLHSGQPRVADLVRTFNQRGKQPPVCMRTRRIYRGSVDSVANLEVTLPVKNSPFYRYDQQRSPSPRPSSTRPISDSKGRKLSVKNRSTDDLLSIPKDEDFEPVRLSVKERVSLFSTYGCGMDSQGNLKTTQSRSRYFRNKTPQASSTLTRESEKEKEQVLNENISEAEKFQSGPMKKSLTLCNLADHTKEPQLASDSDEDSSDSDEIETKDFETSGGETPDIHELPSDARDSGIANEDDENEDTTAQMKEPAKEEGKEEERVNPSPAVVVVRENGCVSSPDLQDSDQSDEACSRRLSKLSECSSGSSVNMDTAPYEPAPDSPVYKRQKSCTLGPVDMSAAMLCPVGKPSLRFEYKRSSLIETDLLYADALWDHTPSDIQELAFKANDVIEILDMSNDDWWYGCVDLCSGWFPASFVRLRVGYDVMSGPVEEKAKVEEEKSDVVEETKQTDFLLPPDALSIFKATDDKTVYGSIKRRKTTIRRNQQESAPRKLSPQEVRAKVVEEILNTEREYIRSLEDITEGYLQRCKQHAALFPQNRRDTLFANSDELLGFQRRFLVDMEAVMDNDSLWKTCVGECFIKHKENFPRYYSEYCNNHPFANSELSELNGDPRYTFFFESCRLLRNMPDLPLDSFLLKPVQKICKYPLQLTELLKYTDKDHPDYKAVVEAVEVMKGVAQTINERKRRVENIYFIGKWRRSVDNWEGEDIMKKSSELIHSGDVVKISKGHAQERHFFLFDHQMVYCKKDAIGSRYTYKGRIATDNCDIIDLADGEVCHGGHPVKNAWKMNNQVKKKWYILYAKSPEVKAEWMAAFEKERQRVKEDKESGYEIPLRLKKAAFEGALTVGKKKKANKGFTESETIVLNKGKGGGVSPSLSSKSVKVSKHKSFSGTASRRVGPTVKVN